LRSRQQSLHTYKHSMALTVQDKAEAKVKQMEARAEEQRRAKQAADAEWRKQQRLREVQRAQVRA
jgi:hypothetical protein